MLATGRSVTCLGSSTRVAFLCWQNFASRLFCSPELHFVDIRCFYGHSSSSPEENLGSFLCINNTDTQFRECVFRHMMVPFGKGSYDCCLNYNNNLGYRKRLQVTADRAHIGCTLGWHWRLACVKWAKLVPVSVALQFHINLTTGVNNPSGQRGLFTETNGYGRTVPIRMHLVTCFNVFKDL